MNDPYAVLGVSADATATDVHAAWRRLAEIYAAPRYSDASPEVQREAARMLAAVNAAYLAIQERTARTQSSTTPRAPRTERERRRRFAAIAAGIVALCVATGAAVLVASPGDSTTAHHATGSSGTSADAAPRVPVSRWLGKYHTFVNEVSAAWNAGPDAQNSILGQQAADAMKQYSQSSQDDAAAAAQLLRAQAAQTTNPELRDQLLADAAAREAQGQQIANSFEEAARTSGAAHEFCGNMIALLRDKQDPLFPSPNRQLDRALGAWIDSTVAYFTKCPLLPDNADASAQLASAITAKRNAVDRLVGGLDG